MTHSTTVCTLLTLFALCVLAPTEARGQSINVDFGSGSLLPPANYAAAGLPGEWNAIGGAHAVSISGFVDLAGNATPITMTNIGGTDLDTDVVSLPQGARGLLSDYLVTVSTTLETCLFFHNLQNGTYRLTTYAWHPTNPQVSSWVTVDQSAGGGQLVGGSWTGQLENGLHYSVHTAVVTNGDLGLHSGIPVGGTPQIAALNGLQLELLPPPQPEFVRGDAGQDGAVDIGDAVGSLAVLFQGDTTSCPAALDTNDDGAHDIADPIAVLGFLFSSAPPPAEPFPSCGIDGTPDLSCATFVACP